MSKTYKLFDDEPYLKEFKAVVTGLNSNEVELDRTAFYAESGGQAGDTGTLGSTRVVDTQYREDKIIHLTEGVPQFTLGEIIKCQIDWERRYRIMKLHSAAHIMEHFLWDQLGKIERLGSYVDDRKDRADYAYEGRLPPEAIKMVEAETNAFLIEGHTIEVTTDPNRPGLRIWRCSNIQMPCAGTHVRNTKEIGVIKLKRKNPGRGVERIETSLS